VELYWLSELTQVSKQYFPVAVIVMQSYPEVMETGYADFGFACFSSVLLCSAKRELGYRP
jgi:hypothetical protein